MKVAFMIFLLSRDSYFYNIKCRQYGQAFRGKKLKMLIQGFAEPQQNKDKIFEIAK